MQKKRDTSKKGTKSTDGVLVPQTAEHTARVSIQLNNKTDISCANNKNKIQKKTEKKSQKKYKRDTLKKGKKSTYVVSLCPRLLNKARVLVNRELASKQYIRPTKKSPSPRRYTAICILHYLKINF